MVLFAAENTGSILDDMYGIDSRTVCRRRWWWWESSLLRATIRKP